MFNYTGEELESFLSADIRAIELDHRQMVYGQPNTTLAWKIDPKLSNNCSVTQILSHSECQQSNPSVDITTSDMSITVASDSLQLSTGKLADFNISSLGDLQTRTCPKLSETVRLNGKYNTVPSSEIKLYDISQLCYYTNMYIHA